MEEKINQLNAVETALNVFICDVETPAMFAAKCRMFKKHVITQRNYLQRIATEKAQNPEINFPENVSREN